MWDLVAVGLVTLNLLLRADDGAAVQPRPLLAAQALQLFPNAQLDGVFAARALQSCIRLFFCFRPRPISDLIDIIYPVHSPSQPLDNTIGAIALYLLMIVVVTS